MSPDEAELLSLLVTVQTMRPPLHCQADVTCAHSPYEKDTKSPFNLQFGLADDFPVTLALLLPLAPIGSNKSPGCAPYFRNRISTPSLS